MKILSLILIILYTIGQMNAQLYFNKIIENNSKNPPFAQNLQYWNDDLILSYGFVDEDDGDKEKTSLVVLNKNNFNKKSEQLIDSIDGGFQSTILVDNNLFVFGNSVRPNPSRFITIGRLDVNFSLSRTKKYMNLNNPSFVLYGLTLNSHLYILSNEHFKGGLSKYNINGDQKFYNLYIDNLLQNSVDNFIKTWDENILISSRITFQNKFGAFGQLQKIDTSGNVVWTYRSNKESRSGASPFFATELSNGNLVQVTEIDRFDATNQYWEYPPLLRWVSQDGIFIKDTVILTKPRLRESVVSGIKKGKGDYFFLRGNRVDVTEGWAWIMKIDNDGKILWSHMYRHPDYTKPGYIHYTADLHEEDNGDLLCYGSVYHQGKGKEELWLFRVNKDGCYGSETCSEEEVLYTAVNEVDTRKDKIPIYPNPTKDKIEISFDENKSGSCSIFDVHGKNEIGINFNAQQKIEVDVSNLNKGTYFVKMRDEKSGEIFTVRFVKL